MEWSGSGCKGGWTGEGEEEENKVGREKRVHDESLCGDWLIGWGKLGKRENKDMRALCLLLYAPVIVVVDIAIDWYHVHGGHGGMMGCYWLLTRVL